MAGHGAAARLFVLGGQMLGDCEKALEAVPAAAEMMLDELLRWRRYAGGRLPAAVPHDLREPIVPPFRYVKQDLAEGPQARPRRPAQVVVGKALLSTTSESLACAQNDVMSSGGYAIASLSL